MGEKGSHCAQGTLGTLKAPGTVDTMVTELAQFPFSTRF